MSLLKEGARDRLKVDLAILDFDDTLVPTEQTTFRIENEIAISLGFIPMTRLVHQGNWGKPIDEAITERVPGIDVPTFMARWVELLPHYASKGKVDVVPARNLQALDTLRRRDIKLAVLTSRTIAEMQHLMVSGHPLNERISKFYLRDDSPFTKPDPRVFDSALKDFGVTPDRVVYIGDNLIDGLAAMDAGIHFVASLESGLRTKEDFRGVPVRHFIRKFSDIVKILYHQSVTIYDSGNVPPDIIQAAKVYRELLPDGQDFVSYIYFSKPELNSLTPRIVKHFNDEAFPQIFSTVANTANASREDRQQYLRELLNVYQQMEPQLEINRKTLLIAPQREGALLVKALGWDKRAQITLLPHAKRVHYKEGIVVGLRDTEFSGKIDNVIVVDGAIASGSTLLALMSLLEDKGIRKIKVYAVHATERGLQTISNFAQKLGIDLTVHVGFVSGILNDHFYGVYPDNPNRLVMGDLGDTISDLFN